MRLQRVAPLDPQCVLVEDVLVAGGDDRRADGGGRGRGGFPPVLGAGGRGRGGPADPWQAGLGGCESGFTFPDTDPKWKDDKGMLEWVAWMKKYNPEGKLEDGFNVYGYTAAQTLVQVLKQCGKDLSRENIMRQAASLKNLELPLLLPGIRINTGPSDFAPISSLQLMKFKGEKWDLFGDVISADAGG